MKRLLLVVLLSVVALLVADSALAATAWARGETPPIASQAFGVLAAVQQAQLLASDGVANDLFGSSIAISGDTALVGAAGAAYVFTRSGGTWSQQAKLTAPDGLGGSVALDGDTAVVGAPGEDVGANPDQGSVYVFARSGGIWSLQAKLTAATGAAYEYFGGRVAVDGDTVVAAVPRPAPGIEGRASGRASRSSDPAHGYVHVFRRSGTVWTQEATLTADGWFGGSVAISGNTALVGPVFTKFGPSDNRGEVWVFSRTGSAWSQQAILNAADGAAGDFFGGSVAICGDAALIGAPYRDNFQGSAYVFSRSATTWSQRARLMASQGGAYDEFGSSVAISDEIALVGAPHGRVDYNVDQGWACSFVRCGSTWRPFERITAGVAEDLFGSSVAVDGGTIAGGAPDVEGYRGAAYVFLVPKPSRPSLISPKGLIASRTPTLRWRATTGASTYEVRVYRGSKLVTAKTGLMVTSWKCTARLPRQVWLTWKVRACNVNGQGPWSSALRIMVR
jgi:FG-GAP repeat